MESQRSIAKNVAADAVHDRMSSGVWRCLQHLIELWSGNFPPPAFPQCPLENSTADTVLGRRMALQDALLVLALANFGKCIIYPGLLVHLLFPAVGELLMGVWKMGSFEKWSEWRSPVL